MRVEGGGEERGPGGAGAGGGVELPGGEEGHEGAGLDAVFHLAGGVGEVVHVVGDVEDVGDVADGGAGGFVAGDEVVELEAFHLRLVGRGVVVARLDVVAAIAEGERGGALPVGEVAGAEPPGVVDLSAVVVVLFPGGAAEVPVVVGERAEVGLVFLEGGAPGGGSGDGDGGTDEAGCSRDSWDQWARPRRRTAAIRRRLGERGRGAGGSEQELRCDCVQTAATS